MVTHAPFLHTTELENFGVICMRSLDASTYEVRCAIAKLLGALIAKTQIPVSDLYAQN
jgi:HEAT repeat-containing protein 5